MDIVSEFFPGLYTLGDILKDNGYYNVFIAGSDTTFAGKKTYMMQHGQYEIYDLTAIETELGKKLAIDQGSLLIDADLFPIARKKIAEVAKQNKPFHVALLTGDTHMRGYLRPECLAKHKGENKKNFELIYECGDEYLSDFIDWIKSQPFYADTTIVIVGDHCNMMSMDAILADDPEEKYVVYADTKRKVYNAFINATPYNKEFHTQHRKFSTMDMFPTILASLGVKIEGERLGLGTNLFSNEKTLLDRYDYDYINNEFLKKSHFYVDYFWKKK